ncbi:MAG TPA: bifunctional demethylmenaquinone methyltransferase/2-methoxy-6-polyprenyl-1,4-benzoquinol methylase UbiE [bacterium]|nr:bifunctional demethylmenaquinone methyltransferase/2-methoxy-6-polyprenyl-1,4-benzoquinol methylase UbiE [bacterium]
MSKEIQQLFTSIAPSYDFLNHFLSFSVDKRWREKVVAALGKETPGRVLDLCAGTLDLTQKILKKYPRAEVFAADFAVAMLEKGREKVRGQAKAHRIGADGHRLPFADHSFDAVVCAFGIRNLEEREKAAAEIRRVMKKGGQLIVLEFFRPERFFSKLFYQTYGKYVLPRIGGAVSRNRKAYEYLQNSIQHFLSVEEYCRLLLDHGFRRPQVLPLSGGIAHRIAVIAA